jgi:hypothetical protein
MYRSFPQLWEGWTKNLVLLFPNARGLALRRGLEFLLIVGSVAGVAIAVIDRDRTALLVNGALAFGLLAFFYQRIRRAHFDWMSNILAIVGLPLFAILLLQSYISYKRGSVEWKGRVYAVDAGSVAQATAGPSAPHSPAAASSLGMTNRKGC